MIDYSTGHPRIHVNPPLQFVQKLNYSQPNWKKLSVESIRTIRLIASVYKFSAQHRTQSLKICVWACQMEVILLSLKRRKNLCYRQQIMSISCFNDSICSIYNDLQHKSEIMFIFAVLFSLERFHQVCYHIYRHFVVFLLFWLAPRHLYGCSFMLGSGGRLFHSSCAVRGNCSARR